MDHENQLGPASLGDALNPFNLPPGYGAGVSGALAYAAALSAFVARYQFLLDAHPNDWLIEEPLARLPVGWLEEYAVLGEPTDLLCSAGGDDDASTTDAGGESTLIEWFAQARRLQMPRQPPPPPSDGTRPLAFPLAQRIFTGAKKCHEVEFMTRAVLAAATAAGGGGGDPCRRVMELGAGVGRLSSVLAMEHGLAVVGVDCSEAFTIKAERRKQWLVAHRKKKKRRRRRRVRVGEEESAAAAAAAAEEEEEEEACWAGVAASCCARICEEMNAADLAALWSTATDATSDEGGGTLLVGMHTCGELAPTMLKLFANALESSLLDDEAAAVAAVAEGRCAPCAATAINGIVNVGCCYNLLGKPPAPWSSRRSSTSATENWPVRDFPLSAALRADDDDACAAPPLVLTRWLCSAAAQSTNPAFVKIARAHKGGALHRPRRLARALLQRRLVHHHPELLDAAKMTKLKTSKFDPFQKEEEEEDRSSFAAFIHSALTSLGVPPNAPELATEAELESEWMKAWADHGASLKLFHCMREAIAPMIEALLLLDRALFLTELPQKPTVRLFPLFDPAISPRNLCLTAFV